MEADYRSRRAVPARYDREAIVVCFSVEDRGFSQDPQIGLQSRRCQAPDCATPREFDRDLLPDQLADFLAYHGQSHYPSRTSTVCPDQIGNRLARSHRKRSRAMQPENTIPRPSLDNAIAFPPLLSIDCVDGTFAAPPTYPQPQQQQKAA